MENSTLVTLLLFNLLLSSCALNKTFLKPTQIADDATSETLYIQGDTVTVNYLGKNNQPQFIRNAAPSCLPAGGQGGDTVQFNHSIESVMFESTSGNLLNGWMIKSKEIKPKATILYLHGNSRDIASTHWSMNKLLKHGFQVFAIDYSGYGMSQGKATRKNVLKDGNSSLNYLLTRPDIKGTKMIIYGQSLGAHLAVVVAKQNEDKIDALITEGAFSSHKAIGREFAGFLGTLFVKEEYSAVDSIGGFHKPILIIHSTEDDIVPFRMGKELFKHANEPKEFYEIDGCHICGSRIYANEIESKILKMINL